MKSEGEGREAEFPGASMLSDFEEVTLDISPPNGPGCCILVFYHDILHVTTCFVSINKAPIQLLSDTQGKCFEGRQLTLFLRYLGGEPT